MQVIGRARPGPSRSTKVDGEASVEAQRQQRREDGQHDDARDDQSAGAPKPMRAGQRADV